ncbi:MAG: hypothetical protein EXQ89_04695 [Rhodospirillaceae bacterium]|nr:hypothetical protein [Rhodospirillaceae bacterium]
MHHDRQTRFQRRGRVAFIALLSAIGGGMLLLWAWNTIAVELFQAPNIRFKHVLAFQMGLAALTMVPLAILRLARHARSGAEEEK